MATSKQKEIFLQEEGDAWFDRNHQVIQNIDYGKTDPVVPVIKSCLSSICGEAKLLEIGCSEGKRLQWISQNLPIQCHGVDPSSKAISVAKKSGVHAIQGTADSLPFESDTFDFLVFGFCLYLCDRQDLFKIAYEADRVLKKEAWLVIHDFFAKSNEKRDYCHQPNVYSYKMDYRTIFDWHPSYTCVNHRIKHHQNQNFTDDVDEWTGISLLRKK